MWVNDSYLTKELQQSEHFYIYSIYFFFRYGLNYNKDDPQPDAVPQS